MNIHALHVHRPDHRSSTHQMASCNPMLAICPVWLFSRRWGTSCIPTKPICTSSGAANAFALKVDRAATVRSQSSLTECLRLCGVSVAHTSHVLRACAVFHRESCLVNQLPSRSANHVHTRGTHTEHSVNTSEFQSTANWLESVYRHVDAASCGSWRASDNWQDGTQLAAREEVRIHKSLTRAACQSPCKKAP